MKLFTLLFIIIIVVSSGCKNTLTPSERLQYRLQDKYDKMMDKKSEEEECAKIRAYYKKFGVEDK